MTENGWREGGTPQWSVSKQGSANRLPGWPWHADAHMACLSGQPTYSFYNCIRDLVHPVVGPVATVMAGTCGPRNS